MERRHLGARSRSARRPAAVKWWRRSPPSRQATVQRSTMAAIGIAVTGNGIAQTGPNGGFDVWATLTATTGAPTAGSAQYVIEFIAPNDGSCAPVPAGATAPAC